MAMRPLDGTSSSPMRFSSVLLPQPEGPMMEMNSPARTSRLMPASATVSMLSVRYNFSTCSSLIITASFLASLQRQFPSVQVLAHVGDHHLVAGLQPLQHLQVGGAGQTQLGGRSEERRVGKECRSRWSPYQ